MMKTEHNFNCVMIDQEKNTFQILDGTKGTYSLDAISKVTILNEKASKKGKQEPFLALMPNKGLPTGVLSDPYLFVGIQITLLSGEKLAIYVSKERTQVGTDQYEKDRQEANKIVSQLKKG